MCCLPRYSPCPRNSQTPAATWSGSFGPAALGTAQAELVALRVCQDEPVLGTLADVHLPRAKGEQPADIASTRCRLLPLRARNLLGYRLVAIGCDAHDDD